MVTLAGLETKGMKRKSLDLSLRCAIFENRRTHYKCYAVDNVHYLRGYLLISSQGMLANEVMVLERGKGMNESTQNEKRGWKIRLR